MGTDKSQLHRVPLGEVLRSHREKSGRSRADVAASTGMTEAAIQRYEQAGVDEDGTFPSSPRLAMLCLELDISPDLALRSCLSDIQHERYREKEFGASPFDHPAFEWILDQYVAYLRDIDILKHTLRIIISELDNPGSIEPELFEWLLTQARTIASVHDDFVGTAYERIGREPLEMDVMVPGAQGARDKSGKLIDWTKFDYAKMRAATLAAERRASVKGVRDPDAKA